MLQSPHMKPALLIALLLASQLLFASPTHAGECFQGSVQVLTGTVVTKSGVFLRDNACMEQSKTLSTLPSGATVKVLGEWDGWFKVEFGGQRGWIYNTFVTNQQTSAQASTDYQAFELANPSGQTGILTTPAPTPTTKPVATNLTLTNRMKGNILLQVESHGEAWYVDPVTSKRYYMKDGPTAYEMMRAFGLGISEADYAKLAKGDLTLRRKLAGRIVLRAQAHGEAYYILPKNLSVNYLKDGAEAYRIMRVLSTGITNTNLNAIPAGQLEAKLPSLPVVTEAAQLPIPSEIDIEGLNVYWLSKVNFLRLDKGLRQLALEPRLETSASTWAAYMASIDTMTHDRPNGQSMNQWIEAQGIPFTERNSVGGWKDNYFSENIAWTYIENDQDSAKAALDDIMEMFLAEAAENGPHYRTQFHTDWNAEGAGFAFKQLPDGRIKFYTTFHYGSVMR